MSGVIVELLAAWLWQGLGLAAMATVVVSFVGRRNAAHSYFLWWAVLAAIVLLPIAAELVSNPSVGSARHVGGFQPVPDVAAAPIIGRPMLTLPPIPESVILLVLIAWFGRAALCLIGVARQAVVLHRRRRRCRPIPSEREHALVRWRARSPRDRQTCLAMVDDGGVPTLLGLGAPIIAIPRVLVQTLTDDELDHVVLHEHAHAQRWDDWTLLVETCLRVLIGFHPGVRMATAALDREREHACDERVLAYGGDRRRYAIALTRVAELALTDQPALAPGMAVRGHALSTRVVRVLHRPQGGTGRAASLAFAGGALVALLTTIAGLAMVPPLVSVTRSARAVSVPAPPRPEVASFEIGPVAVVSPDDGNVLIGIPARRSIQTDVSAKEHQTPPTNRSRLVSTRGRVAHLTRPTELPVAFNVVPPASVADVPAVASVSLRLEASSWSPMATSRRVSTLSPKGTTGLTSAAEPPKPARRRRMGSPVPERRSVAGSAVADLNGHATIPVSTKSVRSTRTKSLGPQTNMSRPRSGGVTEFPPQQSSLESFRPRE
ncbi:MAG: M56 family metallopeptidase [Acidobacteriota bacterium]|nr:M56 family metallopeptidase [Acidobacteriota bacterium]